MDYKTLLDSITKQLDLVQALFFWAMPICLIILWARWRNKEVTIGPVSFDLDTAYIPAIVVFTGATAAIALAFWRLGSFLGSLDSASWNEGVTRLWSHPWLFNPLTFSGSDLGNRATNTIGYGSLILAWWFCLIALSALVNYERQPSWYQCLLALPLITGLLSMLAIQRICDLIVERYRVLHITTWAATSFAASVHDRKLFALFCILFGAVVAALVQRRRLTTADYFIIAGSAATSGCGIELLIWGVILVTLSSAAISACIAAWAFIIGQRVGLLVAGMLVTVLVFMGCWFITVATPSKGLSRERERRRRSFSWF